MNNHIKESVLINKTKKRGMENTLIMASSDSFLLQKDVKLKEFQHERLTFLQLTDMSTLTSIADHIDDETIISIQLLFSK